MNSKILSLLTEEDIREIYEEAESGGTFSDMLTRLRERHGCKQPSVERYEIVLRAAEAATFWHLTSERTMENTLVRCFVSYQMRKEGYTYSEIAHLMKRDHSSVVYHVKRMSNMLSVPGAFKKEMAMWREFERILCE
jgi:hypothetical protein